MTQANRFYFWDDGMVAERNDAMERSTIAQAITVLRRVGIEHIIVRVYARQAIVACRATDYNGAAQWIVRAATANRTYRDCR